MTMRSEERNTEFWEVVTTTIYGGGTEQQGESGQKGRQKKVGDQTS